MTEKITVNDDELEKISGGSESDNFEYKFSVGQTVLESGHFVLTITQQLGWAKDYWHNCPQYEGKIINMLSGYHGGWKIDDIKTIYEDDITLYQ